MTERPLFSDDKPCADWSEARAAADRYGVKGATSLALPRAWTPPFALLSTAMVAAIVGGAAASDVMIATDVERLRNLGERLVIRSSVTGETIWDRGTYLTLPLNSEAGKFADMLETAVREIAATPDGGALGVMVQRRIEASNSGEFGNLQRLSKTRDQWELSTVDRNGVPSRQRLNSQRDQAADPTLPIRVRAGISTERLFGSIAAWLNNELLRGRSHRLTCEWVADSERFYLVQIDQEDEDVWGVNPFQLRVPAFTLPAASAGRRLQPAEGAALRAWDKLRVLDVLWNEGARHKPTLFYVALADLPVVDTGQVVEELARDFRDLIGASGIVVRTSVAEGADKLTNLPRTECMTPEGAATWCVEQALKLRAEHEQPLAFVAHRFVASRASAWVRAVPGNPMVEIHALWGLPDALQYCPYDIWEVHVPTGIATDYPDYKSDMLIARADGGWEHARVKNEIARSNSITTAEARVLADRTLAIADRLDEPVHVMWFVGCSDAEGGSFDLPWYWTKAHEAARNPDRTAYHEVVVSDLNSLASFHVQEGARHRIALALKPTNLDLMRDNDFLERVGQTARAANVPIVLSGSTLAHAYYQLRKIGCAIVTPSEKERSRIRNTAGSGKLVRDRIPSRIAERHEIQSTREVPASLMRGFLVGKLVEEALEVRAAIGPEHRSEELADVFEVLRAMTRIDGLTLELVEQAADRKRERAGGFERGLILMQTGVTADGEVPTDAERGVGPVLGKRVGDDMIELPFSFLGFMDLDQPRSVLLEQFGIRIDITLRPDRIELRVVRSSEQLGLPLENGCAVS